MADFGALQMHELLLLLL